MRRLYHMASTLRSCPGIEAVRPNPAKKSTEVDQLVNIQMHRWVFQGLGVILVVTALGGMSADAQSLSFVTRAGEKLMLDSRPYYPIGVNAYYLMESAAKGDTATVTALFSTARSLGFNVVRTWGFHDSPDSLNPAVIQYRPGAFNEQALRALDYVVLQAKLHGIRLLIPLVNSWEDHGGMNQYVRWRSGYPLFRTYAGTDEPAETASSRIVTGAREQSYRVQITSQLGHDDFFRDSMIVGWFKGYLAMITNRVNKYTGTSYRDDPAIFGWELANEPRSSDQTGELVYRWVGEMSRFLKSIDTHHLVGTGEEGFEVTRDGYGASGYGGQTWMFDGSAGVSFSLNSSVASLDIATAHLYPELWNLSGSEGNRWIRDHIVRASMFGKPLLLGEFGVRANRALTYDSWLSTSLLDGAVGALLWQLLEGSARDTDGFGVRCATEPAVCATLRAYADLYALKGETGSTPSPPRYALHQNYPNPFNAQTVISYDLPRPSRVTLTIYNSLGQRVLTLVDAVQQAGNRKELLDGYELASGVYFYHLVITPAGSDGGEWSQTRKLVLIQ